MTHHAAWLLCPRRSLAGGRPRPRGRLQLYHRRRFVCRVSIHSLLALLLRIFLTGLKLVSLASRGPAAKRHPAPLVGEPDSICEPSLPLLQPRKPSGQESSIPACPYPGRHQHYDLLRPSTFPAWLQPTDGEPLSGISGSTGPVAMHGA